MINDFLFTGGNNSQNASDKVQDISGLPSANVDGLPNHLRPNADFSYSLNKVSNGKPKATIPGIGSYPLLPPSFYASLGLQVNPNSGMTIINNINVFNDGSEPMTIADRLAKAESNAKKPVNDGKEDVFQLFKQQYGNDIQDHQSNTDASGYTDYITGGLYRDADNDELRAIAQTGLEQAGRGILRFLGTTAQAFVEPFVNIGGLMMVPFEGKASIIYDNAITRGMDDLNDKLREALPIYSTRAQQNSDAFSAENLSSGSFWWDRALNGAAFTAGTLLNAWATGGIMSAVGGAMKGSVAARNIAKAAEGMAALEGDAVAMAEVMSNSSKMGLMAKAKNIGSTLSKHSVSYIAASAEGGVEARDLKRQLQPILAEQVAKGEITQAQADRDLESAMNKVYLANVGIVGLSTHLQFGSMLMRGGKSAVNTAAVGFSKGAAGEASEFVAKKWGNGLVAKAVNKTLGLEKVNRFTKFLNYAQYSSPIVGNMLTESLEEGSQFVVSSAAKDYYSNRIGRNFISSMEKGYEETLGTKEGKEGMLIGGLMGLAGAGGNVKQFHEQQKYNQEVAGRLNTYFNDKNSRMYQAMMNYGKTVLHNQNRVAADTDAYTDAEVIDILDGAYMADIAALAHDTGSANVIKEYIQDAVSQEDEQFKRDFPSLGDMTKDQRSKMGDEIVAKFNNLVTLRGNMESKYKNLDPVVRERLYEVHAFHADTEDLYLKQIDELKNKYGVDVNMLNQQAIKNYKESRELDYVSKREAEWTKYINSLGEGVSHETKAQFDAMFAINRRNDIYKEFDANLEVPTHQNIVDPTTGEKTVQQVMEKGNRNKFILNHTNQLIQEALNDNVYNINSPNSEHANQIFENYENLQHSYLLTEDVIRELSRKENEEKILNGYQDTVRRLTDDTVDKQVGKPFKDITKDIKSSKGDNVDAIEKRVNTLNGQIDTRLQELALMATNPNLGYSDEISTEQEIKRLTAYRKQLDEQLVGLKKKYEKSTEAVPAGIVGEEDNRVEVAPVATAPAAPVIDNSKFEKKEEPVEKPSELVDRIYKIKDKVSKARTKIDRMADKADQINNRKLTERIDNLYNSIHSLFADMGILKETVDNYAKLYPEKAIAEVEALETKLVAINETLDAISADFETASVKHEEKNPDEEGKPSNKIVFEGDSIAREHGIVGTTEEKLARLIPTMTAAIEGKSGITDETSMFTLAEVPGTPKGDVAKGMNLIEMAYVIFGDGNRQQGLLHDYIREVHGEESVNNILNDSFSTMKVLNNMFEKFNTKEGESTKSLSPQLYRYLWGQYVALRSNNPLRDNEMAYYSHDYFRSNMIGKRQVFITSATNVKSIDFTKATWKLDNDSYQLDYANTVSANRATVKGNKILEDLLDLDKVHTGAAASFSIPNMNMTVDGKAQQVHDIITKLREGRIDEVSIDEIGELPIDVLNKDGEKIGKLKTVSDIDHLASTNKLPASLKPIEGENGIETVNAGEHERMVALENRFNILFHYMVNPDAKSIPTTITRRGVGYAESVTVKDFVRNLIKVPGSKILVAKDNGVELRLVENDNKRFSGKIHNENPAKSLINGVAYIAIPVNKYHSQEDGATEEPVYMIMPLQSMKIENIHGGDLARNEKATYHDKRSKTVANPTEENPDNVTKLKSVQWFRENTIGERIRMSMVTAIDIHMKLAAGFQPSEHEETIRQTLADKEYDISSVKGLSKYLKEFVHTYDLNPVDLKGTNEDEVSIDTLLYNRIKENNVSVFRVKHKMIEIGKVKNGIAEVISIYEKDGAVNISRYTFNSNLNLQDGKVSRKYERLDNKNYKDQVLRGIYDMTDTAFLRIDAAKLNINKPHQVPLVNLVSSDSIYQVVNGNYTTVYFGSEVNKEEPIQSDAINFDNYDDYAASILQADFKTSMVGDKHVYSTKAAVHVDTEKLAIVNRNAKVNDMTFEDFKRKVFNQKSAPKKVNLIGKFKASEIANFKTSRDTAFAKAFGKTFDSFANTFDITFNNDGSVNITDNDKKGGLVVRFDTMDETVSANNVYSMIVDALNTMVVPGEITTMTFMESKLKVDSPVRKEVSQPTTTAIVADPSKAFEKPAQTNDQLNPTDSILNGFKAMLAKDFDKVSKSAPAIRAMLVNAGMSEVDAQEKVEAAKNDVRSFLDNPDNIGSFTLAPINKEAFEGKDIDVNNIAVSSGAVDSKGKYVKFSAIHRAVAVAAAFNKNTEGTPFQARVVEVVENNVNVKYIVYIDNNADHMEIFGDGYVKLLQAVNENKGFVPFVSPVVLNEIRNNLGNVFWTTLIDKANDNKAIDNVVANQVSRWQGQLEAMDSSIEIAQMMGQTNMVNYLTKDKVMLKSLIDNIGTVKDMVVQDLLADNMIHLDRKNGQLVVKSADTSFLKGESANDDYTEEGDAVGDSIEDIDETELVTPENAGNNAEEASTKENNSHWDSGSLSVDPASNASAKIKRFLRGIEHAKYNSAGQKVVILNKFDDPQYLNYKDVYSKLLRLLSNKPQTIESVVETLKAESSEDPMYATVLERLNVEIADRKSSIPFEFVKLVNKNRVDMKYVWLTTNNIKKGGIVNKIGDSNKSNIRNVIMDQWQAQFTSTEFVNINNEGVTTTDAAKIKVHMENFNISSAEITALLGALHQVDLTNVGENGELSSVKNINMKVKSYNEFLATKADKPGYAYFRKANVVKTLADLQELRSNLRGDIKQFVKAYTNPVGFLLSEATIDRLIDKQTNPKNKEGITRYFLSGNKSNFKVVLDSLANIGRDVDLSFNNIEPYIKEAIKPILNLEATVNNGVSPDVYRDRAGKSTYAYTNYKYMDEVLSELHDKDQHLWREITSTSFGKNCYLLEDLMKRINQINEDRSDNPYDNGNNLRFTYTDSLVVQGANNKTQSVKLDEAKEGDIEVSKLLYFFNRGNREANFFYPTLSDGKSLVMLGMTRQEVSFDVKDKVVRLSKSTIDQMFDKIVMPEIERIMAAARIKESGVNIDILDYEKGAGHFILNDYLDKYLAKYDDKKTGLRTIPTGNEFKAKLIEDTKAEFAKFADKTIKDKVEQWKRMGIVVGNKVRIMDDRTGKDRHYASTAYEVAAEFELNYMIFNMGANQIFMGDTATYWKGSVNGTIDNMSKRLAGHRGPGEIGVTSNNNSVMTVVTAGDVKLHSVAKDFLNSVKERGAITTTDGQELTSLYEDLHNRMVYNGMSRALFDALYNDKDAVIFDAFEKMFGENGNEDLNYDEFIEAHLKKKDVDLYEEYIKMVNQPVKPMYFGTRSKQFGNESIRSAVYIKSSSFPLRPSLTKNFAIDKLRKAMDYSTWKYLKAVREGKDEKTAHAEMIDRYSYVSAVKLGASTKSKDIDGNESFGFEKGSYKDLYTKLNAASEVLPRKGFRIQQDLPFDFHKSKINAGSQERKLLFNGIAGVKGMKDLKEQYDKLYQKLYKKGYDDIMAELMENGELNYEKLSAIIIKEGLSRKYDDNDIAELRTNAEGTGLEGKIMFHRRDTAIESLLLSIVDNRILKMKFPGRSFVLGTEAGFTRFEQGTSITTEQHDRAGIIYTSKFDGQLKPHGFVALKALEKDGVTYKANDYIRVEDLSKFKVDEDFYYQPDQIIIPSFFKDAKGKLINLKEGLDKKTGNGKYVKLGANNRLELKEEMFDPEVLRTFGFRIPTQGHSSMASMEIVGFTDYTVGELVIAPKDFVDRMGSDFDIDKLYMYRYSMAKTKPDAQKAAIYAAAKEKLSCIVGDANLDDVFKAISNYFEKRNDRFNNANYKALVEASVAQAIEEQSLYYADQNKSEIAAYVSEALKGDTNFLINLNQSTYKKLDKDDVNIRALKKALTIATFTYEASLMEGVETFTKGDKSVLKLITEMNSSLEAIKSSKQDVSRFTKEVSMEKSGIINEIIKIHHDVFKTPDATVQRNIANPLSYGFFEQEYVPDSTVKDLYDKVKVGKKDLFIGEFIEELYGEGNNTLSPLTSTYQSNFYQKGKMGKDGIANFSSRSVVNAVLQQAMFNDAPIAMGSTARNGSFTATTFDLTLGGHKFTGVNFGNNKVVDVRDFTVADVISWYQSTSVDNAKLNKLHKLNINEATIDVINFMNQAGFHEHVLWLINQPIIREYATLLNSQNGVIGKPTIESDAKAEVQKRYNVNALQAFVKDNKNSVEGETNEENVKGFRFNTRFTSYKNSIGAMAEQIQNYLPNRAKIGSGKTEKLNDAEIDFFGTQLAILEEFLYIHKKHGGAFKTMASILNIDSKGLGANVTELAEKRNKVLEVVGETRKTFKNIDKIFGKFIEEKEYLDKKDKGEDVSGYVKLGGYYIEPSGVVGSSAIYALSAFESLFAKQFLQFDLNFDLASKEISKNFDRNGLNAYDAKTMQAKLIGDYKKYAHSYALASAGFNIDYEYNRLLVDEIVRTYDDKGKVIDKSVSKPSIASIVLDIQKTQFKDNPLIASMTAIQGGKTRMAELLFNNAAGVNDQDGKITAAVYDMIVGNPTLIEYNKATGRRYTGRDLIRDIFIYSELTGGVQRFSEMVKFMPHELKKLIGFADALNGATEAKPVNNLGYLIQFIQHNPEYARDIKYTPADNGKGIIRAQALNKSIDKDKNGVETITYAPIGYEGVGSISHVLIDPYKYKVGKSGKTGIMLADNTPNIPVVIKDRYVDKNTGVVKTRLYKQVFTSEIDNGDNPRSTYDKTMYNPLIISGHYVYERVEELGNGSKTEYDATISPVSAKLSALNNKVRITYHKTTDLELAAYASTGNATDFVFKDYSEAALKQALDHIANSEGGSVVARTMAKLFKDVNLLDKVNVIASSKLKEMPDNELEGFMKKLKETSLDHGNPMKFTYDAASNTGYIVVNEDAYKGSMNVVENVQKDFIHELGHMITENDNQTVKDNDGLFKIVSKFKKSGDILINDVIKHLSKKENKTWDDDLSIEEIISGLRKAVSTDTNTIGSMPRNEFVKKYRKYYGLINFKEFYSELASNDDFVDMLSSIPSSKKLSDKESDVIANATVFGDSILGQFLKVFKDFINDILTLIHGEGVQVNENSVAYFAMYEFVVSAKKYDKVVRTINAETLSIPYRLQQKAATIKGKVASLLLEDSDTTEYDNDSTDQKGVSQANALSMLMDEGTNGNDNISVDDAMSMLMNDSFVIGNNSPWQDHSYTTNSNIIDDKKAEAILRELNKGGRLEYACKL